MGLDNILSFGGKKKLEKEQTELNSIISRYNIIENEYIRLLKSRRTFVSILENERFEAERNFTLLTSLIEVIKSTSRSGSKKVQDDLFVAAQNISYQDTFVHAVVDDQRIFDQSLSQFTDFGQGTVTRVIDSFANNGKISKNEVKEELVGLGISAVLSGVSYIGGLNSEISEKRREIAQLREEIQSNLELILTNYREIYKDSTRARELAIILNKNNEVFLNIYSNLVFKYFVDFDFDNLKTSSREALSKDSYFLQELKKLISICGDYSRIRETKVTREINN
ncbi:hypothetical protein ACYSNM_08270 [Myroides sp. LJL116]